ncbi:hypothetical protein [Clostridium sp. KNHs216]|nr:hypothetical protein [Clostridium sp. KNHs216]
MARYKKALRGKMKNKALSIHDLPFKDTMHSLIQKDVQSLLQVMGNE